MRQVCLQQVIKALCPLGSKFLFYTPIHCMHWHWPVLVTLSCRTWDLRNLCKVRRCDVLATAIVLNNKRPWSQMEESNIFCQNPWMYPRIYINFWAHKQHKSLDLSQFWHLSVTLTLSLNNIGSFCFLSFKALSLASYTFRIIISYWWLFSIHKEKSFFI